LPRGGTKLKPEIKKLLLEGGVIPAHPLGLNSSRKLDEIRQRVLTLYYIAAGASGVALGVHSTQFEIRKYGLFEPVLRIASETIENTRMDRPFIKMAGVCGPTEQALNEASIASDLGYDLGLVSVVGVEDWSEDRLVDRLEKISQVIPVFGFYLQPSVGGVPLSFQYWRKVAELPNVHAIKIAPFNRYRTLDVVHAVVQSNRRDEIALYTGNDDNIVHDLLTPYRFRVDGKKIEKYMVGGLLGQWGVWTKGAVNLLEQIRGFQSSIVAEKSNQVAFELLRVAAELTDANAAIFDAKNNFRGVLPGINEILKRQGLVESIVTLEPNSSTLSPGQLEEIDRIWNDYPHLHSEDDTFIAENLENWLENARKM
jgi:hypothetical protein